MRIVAGLLIVVVTLVALYMLIGNGYFSPLAELGRDIVQGFNAGYGYNSSPTSTISVHYREAVIRFVSLGEGQSEVRQAIIVAHPKNLGYLDVTGWKLKTDGGTVNIPRAYNAYSPSTKDAAPENIVMREGDRLYIISGKSPDDRNERVSAGEWHIFAGDFLPVPHGHLYLEDASSSLVDQYEY